MRVYFRCLVSFFLIVKEAWTHDLSVLYNPGYSPVLRRLYFT